MGWVIIFAVGWIEILEREKMQTEETFHANSVI
jgi:hypothetical protein